MRADPDRVFVEAAARLHFGVLDLRGARGRWFGGIGAAAPAPTLLVSAGAAERLEVSGEDADRAAEFAARFLAHHGVHGGARLQVHRTLPRHRGLGSGTQLALAVARVLAELQRLPTDVRSLARAVGRARRSAVGSWTFDGGGLVVEGGRQPAGDECGPLIARLAFPPEWRCVLVVPDAVQPGISGAAEEAAFASLPAPPEREVERVAHVTLMALLPAIADADLPAFGRALTDIQALTGSWFAAVQGGVYARGPSMDLIRRMLDAGACGVGQSSWGPAVYGIVAGEQDGLVLADRMRSAIGGAGSVFVGPFRAEGARVWKGRSAERHRVLFSADRDRK
jgi:beta-RFAP synthase